MSFITVAAATLPSCPLDFDGNKKRILESIQIAKEKGARLRTGPELEVPGYGCLDHFLEGDTCLHSWEVLADIINNPICKDMLLDIGIPLRHRNVLYNTRVLCTYRHIYGIRPKMAMANEGLYREARFFIPWSKPRTVENYYLEECAREVTGQATVPIGDFILSARDTALACESCEELFVPKNPSSASGLNGAEIILNSSASHAELRKLRTRLDLIANSTRKLGGAYVYANAIGVDGEARMLFDGSSMVIVNGEVVAQSSQFSLLPVEVTLATIDVEQIRSFRNGHSRGVQAAVQEEFPRIECELKLGRTAEDIYLSPTLHLSKPIDLKILDPMEEIHMATSVYLWQYLTRTNSAGFFLALSGGLDSATVALFVHGMARLVLLSIEKGESSTLNDLRRVTGEPDFTPKNTQEIVSRLLHTCYMGTVNSSEETQSRSRRLAETLGSYHSNVTIDEAVTAFEDIAGQALSGFKPKFEMDGGTRAEQLAKQNVQARARMVLQYELAQLSTTARKMPRAGSALLVLGSGNVDENLRGYYTKYDASSADLSPLGSISKNDAKAFQRWAKIHWNLEIMGEFIEATPTAELLPLSAGVQDDESENEMGMTYEELSVFGLHRIKDRLGPWSMYLRLLGEWGHRTPREVADKVIRFFFFYSLNRHKSTIVTPSVHLSAYNPDDNRHDERPFLYVVSWPYQKRKILAHVEQLEKKLADRKALPAA